MKQYNFNYNCNISYKIGKKLKNVYMKYLVKKECRKKFLYESNIYTTRNDYKPLNLSDSKDKKIYDEFFNILRENYILDGEILKLFSSCFDYHCKELINKIKDIKDDIQKLDDMPILFIILYIINIKKETYIKFYENSILVNWEKTIEIFNNISAYKGLKKEEKYDVAKIQEILNTFKEKYNPIITENDDEHIVRFINKKMYYKFKQKALKISKPYYIFEGDVLDLIRIEKEYEGIIELKAWDDFSITNVLAKILGFRNDY